MDETIRNIAVYALPVMFAITLHEAAHAYVAKYFGDNTAYAAGRMTLNPMVHIDLFGTILLPLGIYLYTTYRFGQGFVFGYAKPVPIDFNRLKNARRDMAWVALAGPGANFVMALMWLIVAILLAFFQVDEIFPHRVAHAGVLANVLMFAFNLIPIPPLDGGRIAVSLLPNKLACQYAKIEPYGFFILLALLYFQVLNFWVGPMMSLANSALNVLATPLIFLIR
jgi:Zn-dependent protease